MTITSYGYAGDIDAAAWSKVLQRVGLSAYGVATNTDWKVAPAAGTRTVSIAAGTGWGKGVYDVSSAVVNLPFDSVPSGVRYDMVVMRRTWSSGTSVFAVVAGGSTKTLPSRSISSGDGVDEQPLALVQITAGSSAVQVVADLRVIAAETGLIGFDDLCRSYLTRPGTMLTINGVRWQRTYSSTGTIQWERYDYTNFVQLWSGVYFMTPSQVANLSQRLSAQKTGIILVWSAYDDDAHAAHDDTWTYTHVPKIHNSVPGSNGVQCVMAQNDNPSAGPIVKYVYVDDDKIRGHEMNDDGMARGRVLRRVYGY